MVPKTNLPETPSSTEGETRKAKSEGFQEDRMGWFQKEGFLFLLGNMQWKFIYSLDATTPKITRKVLQRIRPPKDYKAGILFMSHLAIKQSPRNSQTPAGLAHPTTVRNLPRTGRQTLPRCQFLKDVNTY